MNHQRICFQFKPVAKLWFIGNESPPTKSSGRELQRRFHVYEFLREISDKDMDVDLGAKLRAEAEYVLGWAIDGAKAYYSTGLFRSPHVIASTVRYFSDADILEQWKEECCVVDPAAVTAVAALYQSFSYWAEDAGVRFKPDKGRFSQRLKAKGYALERRVIEKGKSAVRVVVGLRLDTNDDSPF